MNLNVNSWKEFRLGDLFSEMYKAEAHVKGELECFDVPSDNTIRFISRTEMNNGCDCYVLNNDLSGIEKANAIAIGDTTATCFLSGVKTSCAEIIWLYVVEIGSICIQHCLLFQYLNEKNTNIAMAEPSKWN